MGQIPRKMHQGGNSMWWFTKKSKSAPVAQTINPRQQAERELIDLVPDMTGVADKQEVAIKIWLPEIVARNVNWMATYYGQSQSAWIRERLIAYTYGSVALQALWFQRDRAERDVARFSRKMVDRSKGRWVYKVPQLGKNTVAFKLWISEQLCSDLHALAEHAQIGLSAFVREAIIAEMLGRASLPERPEILGQPTETAQAWERGEEVPIVELEEDQFDGLGDSDREWVEETSPLKLENSKI